MIDITFLVLFAYFGQIVASAIAGAFLLFRAIKSRYFYLAYMAIGLLLQAVSVFMPGNIGRAVFNFNYPVALVIFVREAYFKGRLRVTSANAIIIVVVLLKCVQAVETIIFDMSVPATKPVPDGKLTAYFFHVTVVTALIAVAYGWYFVQARRTLVESRRNKLPLWAVRRNQFMTWSAGLFAATPAIWFFFPTTQTGFDGPLYVIVGIAGFLLTVAFSVFTMLAWITPESLKRLLDPKHASTADILARFDLMPGLFGPGGPSSAPNTTCTETDARRFNSPEIVRIVDYIGQYVAKITGRPPAAMKGLLLISIEKELGERSMFSLTFGEIKAVINSTFKGQLSQFLTSDARVTFDKINTFLGENQANLMALVV